MKLPVTDTVRVILARPWGPYAAGTEVEVDATKAGTLDEMGYLATDEPKRKKRKGTD